MLGGGGESGRAAGRELIGSSVAKAAGPRIATWLDSPVTALMLGTAQWGHGYGVTNAVGRLDDDAIADIVAVAREWDIDDVDTALGYGDAQARLRPFAREFAVTT